MISNAISTTFSTAFISNCHDKGNHLLNAMIHANLLDTRAMLNLNDTAMNKIQSLKNLPTYERGMQINSKLKYTPESTLSEACPAYHGNTE